MSSPVGSSPEDDELQFTSVEPAATGPVAEASGVCVGCGQPIVSQYFALGDKMLCPACCANVQAPPGGSRMGRFFKATMLGLVAGLLGALIWYVIRRVSHFEIGLVAVLVGFMVGKAVRAGSGGRGGRRYQVLAVVLTYCCIAANYMPDVLSAFIDVAREKHWTDASTTQPSDAASTAAPTTASADGSSGVAATQATAGGQRSDHHEKPSIGKMVLAVVVLIVLVFGVALAAPFMAGAQNLIGLLIIGFALWEAWKFNRRRVLPITGPYDFAGGTP